MNKLDEKSLQRVVAIACELFLSSSVSAVRMEEIAKKAGVGVASLYRHYGTKQNLILSCAVHLAKEVYETYFSAEGAESGLEKLRCFYGAYLEVFRGHREYFRFIEELDSLILLETKESKTAYEEAVDRFFEQFLVFYGEGVGDGSVYPVGNVKLFYRSTTQALLNLCKKLACRGRLIRQDGEDRAEEEVQILLDLFLFRLSGGESVHNQK